jgi:hypothetical protein
VPDKMPDPDEISWKEAWQNGFLPLGRVLFGLFIAVSVLGGDVVRLELAC